MADPVGMGLQLAGNAVRFGWYSGVNWMLGREARRYGKRPPYTPSRPVPTQAELFADFVRCWCATRAGGRGVLPPAGDETSLPDHLDRVRAMFADLARSVPRRIAGEPTTARELPDAADLPELLHSGLPLPDRGLSQRGFGAALRRAGRDAVLRRAAAMRRAAIPPIASSSPGATSAASSCSTSPGPGASCARCGSRSRPSAPRVSTCRGPYFAEARRHLEGLRPVELVAGNAEHLPFPDASQDVVTTIYLYHELPAEVRRRVTAEIARVLKPGGSCLRRQPAVRRPAGWDGCWRPRPLPRALLPPLPSTTSRASSPAMAWPGAPRRRHSCPRSWSARNDECPLPDGGGQPSELYVSLTQTPNASVPRARRGRSRGSRGARRSDGRRSGGHRSRRSGDA